MSILFTLDDFTNVEKVTMPWAGETYFIPAGTPMSADGIANDGNAIGILAENARLEYEYDYGTNPYGKVDYTYSVITHGYVNTEDAEASFGGTYSDACRSALSNIVFCDNHKIGIDGGGGEDVWEHAATLKVEEDGVTEILQDLGANYKKLLISTQKDKDAPLYATSNFSQRITSSGTLCIYLYDGSSFENTDSLFYATNINTPLAINTAISCDASRPYSFLIDDIGDFVNIYGCMNSLSGGFNSAGGSNFGMCSPRKYDTSAKIRSIKITTTSASNTFVNGLVLNVWGVKA